MTEITNYYKELNLSAEMSIEEIDSRLRQLETVWNQRNEPKKADRLLSLINDARGKFSTPEAKAEYDQILTDKHRLDEYRKAKSEVDNYVNSEQWDLAKSAIVKTLSLAEKVKINVSEKLDIYVQALNIYIENELFEHALEFANKSIVISPDSLFCYANKEWVLYVIIEERKKLNFDISQLVNKYRTTCKIWANKAKKQNVFNSAANALSYLAGAYINYQPKDYYTAEQCVTEALELDPNCEGAKKVLQWLNRPKQVSFEEINYPSASTQALCSGSYVARSQHLPFGLASQDQKRGMEASLSLFLHIIKYA